MKDFLTWLIGYMIGVFVGWSITQGYNKDKLELPEEYTQISTNHYKPDTLLGFYINDKLHIEFKPKTK